MSNFFELLSGARLSNELGHRFEQWGIPTSWAENWGDALAPTVMPHHLTAYYSARERGQSPTQSRQFATNDAIRTAAAAAAFYAGGEAAFGGDGAAAGGGATSGFTGSSGAALSGASGGESSTLFGSLYGGSTAAPSLGGFGSAGEVGGSGVANGLGAGAGGGFFNSGGGTLGGGGSSLNYTKLLQKALNGYSQGKQQGGQSSMPQQVQLNDPNLAPAAVGQLNPSAPQQQAPDPISKNAQILAALLMRDR